MTTQYAGNEVFPSDFSIVDDPVVPLAATWNVALEALGDRTKYLQARIDPITLSDLQDINTTSLANGVTRYVGTYGFYVFNSASSQVDDEPGCVAPNIGPGRWFQQNPFQNDHTFTADTTWIVPATGFYLIQGCGGGGGGGGSKACTTATEPGQGGGGGAGANLVSRVVFLNQGTSCSLVVGAPGTFGGIGQDGNDGVDSSFTCSGISIVFEGGGGGCGGSNFDWLASGGGPVGGGNPCRTAAHGPRLESVAGPFVPSGAAPWIPTWPGSGGFTDSFYRAGISNASSNGVHSSTGFAGGAKGTEGAASPVHGGQGGGGGGGGAFGVGAAGGAGGAGGGAGTGANGTIGATAANNTGAGGGGAGAPGAGGTGSGTAAHGGSGGSGLIYIVGLS